MHATPLLDRIIKVKLARLPLPVVKPAACAWCGRVDCPNRALYGSIRA